MKILPEEQSVNSWLPFFAEAMGGYIKEIKLTTQLTLQLKITGN